MSLSQKYEERVRKLPFSLDIEVEFKCNYRYLL